MADDRATRNQKSYAYADAMLESAMLEGGMDAVLRVHEDLDAIFLSYTRNVAIVKFIKDGYAFGDVDSSSPGQEAQIKQNKHTFIEDTFKGACDVVITYLKVMSDYGDMELLPVVFESFNGLVETRYNTVIADVFTAVELDDYLRGLIVDKLSKDLQAKIMLHEHVDKDTLGGIKIVAKGRQIDNTLNGLLTSARKELKSTARS